MSSHLHNLWLRDRSMISQKKKYYTQSVMPTSIRNGTGIIPTTINQYIRNTMEDNFKLFEKYPDYVFNFTGSRRYKMMKEYYPESYKKVADYINQGRWYVSGSSVDEGEVNISSSESVLRQVLYGNLYFKREFNKESVDYMLPDCFGFVATMPSVWSHAGLLGFSTQKLTWRSSNGVPFNVGAVGRS